MTTMWKKAGATGAAAALGWAALATGVAVGALQGAPDAAALPPSGAGTSTPGTSSTVSPGTLAPCETLSYELRGFPAGETVYVKIDDGIGQGNSAIQGAGVVAQQRINASGVAAGSFELPCDIAEGDHTLRFLATETFGGDGESRGFTNKSPVFVVKAASDHTDTSGGGGTSGNAGNSGNSGGGNSGNSGDSGAGDGGDAAAAQGGGQGGADAGQQSGGSVRTTVVRPGASGGTVSSGGSGAPSGASGSAGSRSGGAAASAARAAGSGASVPGSLGFASSGSGAAEYALADDGSVVPVNSGRSDAPIVGLIVGGCILIVGFAAIGAFLYTRSGGSRQFAGTAAPTGQPLPQQGWDEDLDYNATQR